MKDRRPGRGLPQHRIRRSKDCGHRRADARAAKGQFCRNRQRLPVRPVFDHSIPPAGGRAPGAWGAVDDAEYIHSVFQGAVKNEHPFKPCDAEHA